MFAYKRKLNFFSRFGKHFLKSCTVIKNSTSSAVNNPRNMLSIACFPVKVLLKKIFPIKLRIMTNYVLTSEP